MICQAAVQERGLSKIKNLRDDLTEAFIDIVFADIGGDFFKFLPVSRFKQRIKHENAVGENLEKGKVCKRVPENHHIVF